MDDPPSESGLPGGMLRLTLSAREVSLRQNALALILLEKGIMTIAEYETAIVEARVAAL